MQWNRNDRRKLARESLRNAPPHPRQQLTQSLPQPFATLKFQLQNRRAQIPRVQPVASRPIEFERFLATPSALG
jgi:hypothetical protein